MEKMMKYYNDMSEFIDETGATIKMWAGNLSGKSDDPDEYLSRKNLKKLEKILVHDKQLGEELVNMGSNLRQKDEKRKKDLLLAYAKILEEDVMK